MIKIAPSILAADTLNLGAEARRMLEAGADWLHVDVMDGHFVPNLSYGPAVVRALRGMDGQAFLDVHLMISQPEKYAGVFAQAGASRITIHCEAEGDLPAVLRDIRARGLSCGVSVKPQTPVAAIEPLLPLADMVLVMTVEPGFGGQSFMADMLPKLRALRAMGFAGDLQVDGGVNEEAAPLCVAAGANVLVMGTALYRARDAAALITRIRESGHA